MAQEQGSAPTEETLTVGTDADGGEGFTPNEVEPSHDTPEMDDETAALLRSLEESAPSDSAAGPSDLPGHGVLRPRNRRDALQQHADRQHSEPGQPTLMQSADAYPTYPSVIAYEPIQVDVPWGTPTLEPAPLLPMQDAASAEDAVALLAELEGAADLGGAGPRDTLPAMAAHVPVDPTPPSPPPTADTAGFDAAPTSGAEFFFEDDGLGADEAAEEDEGLEELEDDFEELDSSDELSLSEPAAQQRRPETPPPKPPRPPKPPPAAPRRPMRDDEVVITHEALADLLPGGRSDEARDLDHTRFTDNNWYREVFNEDYFRTLPKNFHRQTLREVDFIVNQLGLEPGARLLDLCCGFGRHTMELAKRGFAMVGLDLAMPLLQKALNEAQRRKLSIKFVHGDMRELNFDAVFDGIFNVQTSFGYFNDQTNFRVLQGMKRALKPGGRILIEALNRDFVVEELPTRIWWEGTECLILEEVDYDFPLGVLRVKRSFVFEDSSREPWEQQINVRLYTPQEYHSLLRRVGLEVVEMSGDYTIPGAFFGAASQRLIIVAERPVDG